MNESNVENVGATSGNESSASNTNDAERYVDETERLKRWRLVLGQEAEDATGGLSGESAEIDGVLAALYSSSSRSADGSRRDRGRGGLGGSAPSVARWLGDIRKYFPKSVVQTMQRDALERLGLTQMLTEPELLETLEVDVKLVATLLSLSRVVPEKTKATARLVVGKLVDELLRQLAAKTIAAVRGSLNRASRTNRPRAGELDFDRTIRLNLKNWLPDERLLVVDRLAGFGRKRRSLREVVLCVDQSGSMASSVVYSSIFAAVLASIPTLATKLILFDTEIADLTEMLRDPVDVLFGAQLGGGTDINQALAYSRTKISRPSQTIFVLISDLYDGANFAETAARAEEMVRAGVNFICLLALDDDGATAFDERNAAILAKLGIPSFACSPDKFPELIAAAINRRDVALWAGRNEIRLVAPLKSD